MFSKAVCFRALKVVTVWERVKSNLDSSKLKEFADNNFKFDESGRTLYKRVENIVGKGEIADYKQLLLFPQCFQKTCTNCRHVKTRACLGNG